MRPRHRTPAVLLAVIVTVLLSACRGHDPAPGKATCRSRSRVPSEVLAAGDVEAVQMTYARCEPWFAELCAALEGYAEVTKVPVLNALVDGPGPQYATDVRDAVGADRLKESHRALLAPVVDAEGSVARDLEVVIRGLPDGTPEDDAPVTTSSSRIARRWLATLEACAPDG